MNEKSTAFMTPLGKTALYICAARAKETRDRSPSERLFSDPYAEILAGEYGFEYLKAEPNLEIKSIVRTAYFDKVIEKALSIDNIQQFVILAVGGDCRPYRLENLKNCKVFEIDMPDLIQYRKQILEGLGAKCSGELFSIGLDLRNHEILAEKLMEKGFSPFKKSIFLIEGLLHYLTLVDVESLIKSISDICLKGSIITGDINSVGFFTSESTEKEREVWGM